MSRMNLSPWVWKREEKTGGKIPERMRKLFLAVSLHHVSPVFPTRPRRGGILPELHLLLLSCLLF